MSNGLSILFLKCGITWSKTELILYVVILCIDLVSSNYSSFQVSTIKKTLVFRLQFLKMCSYLERNMLCLSFVDVCYLNWSFLCLFHGRIHICIHYFNWKYTEWFEHDIIYTFSIPVWSCTSLNIVLLNIVVHAKIFQGAVTYCYCPNFPMCLWGTCQIVRFNRC